MNQFTTDYVGLDVHKESVDISVASAGDAEVRHVGKVAGDLNAVTRALRRLEKDGRRLHIVYVRISAHRGRCFSGIVDGISEERGRHFRLIVDAVSD